MGRDLRAAGFGRWQRLEQRRALFQNLLVPSRLGCLGIRRLRGGGRTACVVHPVKSTLWGGQRHRKREGVDAGSKDVMDALQKHRQAGSCVRRSGNGIHRGVHRLRALTPGDVVGDCQAQLAVGEPPCRPEDVHQRTVFADVAIFKLQLQAAFHDTVCLLLGGLAVCRVDEIEHLETHSLFRGVPKNAFKRRAHVDHLAVGIDDTDCVEQEIHNVLGRYSLHWRFPVLLSGCKPPQWSPSIACRVIQEMTPHFAGGIPFVSATHTCCEKRYATSIFSKNIFCYGFDSCWRFMNERWRPIFLYFLRRPSYLGIQQNG